MNTDRLREVCIYYQHENSVNSPIQGNGTKQWVRLLYELTTFISLKYCPLCDTYLIDVWIIVFRWLVVIILTVRVLNVHVNLFLTRNKTKISSKNSQSLLLYCTEFRSWKSWATESYFGNAQFSSWVNVLESCIDDKRFDLYWRQKLLLLTIINNIIHFY